MSALNVSLSDRNKQNAYKDQLSQLPELVAPSWERSFAFGVNYDMDVLPKVSAQDKNIALANVSGTIAYTRRSFLSYLKSIGELLDTLGSVIFYIDHSLHVCGLRGNTELLNVMREKNISFGADLSEKSAGTNAVSLAREFMKAIDLAPGESYSRVLRDYHCFASNPLRIGIDDIFFAMVIIPKEKVSDKTRAAVNLALISLDELSERNEIPDAMVANTMLEALMKRTGFSYIIIDGQGMISNIGRDILKMFHLQGSQTIGLSLSTAFPGFSQVQNTWKTASGADREFKIRDASIEGVQISVSAIPLSKEKNGYTALILNSPIFLGANGKMSNGTMFTIEDLWGDSKVMEDLRCDIRDCAEHDDTVLIVGENGSGKEVIAQSIHNLSTRAGKPFVACSCALLSEEGMEALLFGRSTDRKGLFEAANGGTLLFDEVHDLSLEIQALLIRLLDTQTVMRLDDMATKHIDARVLFTSGHDPRKLVEKGLLRPDLYYRISGIRIDAPRLSEHAEDIPQIAQKMYAAELMKRGGGVTKALPDVQEFNALKNLQWQGNVRQLANEVKTLVSESRRIPFKKAMERVIDQHLTIVTNNHEIGISGKLKDESYSEYEKTLLIDAMRNNHGNKTAVAKELNMARQTLYSRLEKYGIS